MTEIDGLDQLIKQFALLGEDMTYKLAEPSTRGAELIAARAKSKINNISGDLARGIKVRKPGNKSKSRMKVFAYVTLGQSASHGVNVELGHKLSGYFGTQAGSNNKRVPEHPFLRPAADESKSECANILTNAMNQIIKEYSP